MAVKTKILYTKAFSEPSPPVVDQRCDNLFKNIWGNESSSSRILIGNVSSTYGNRVIQSTQSFKDLSEITEFLAIEPLASIPAGNGAGYDFNILDPTKKYTIGMGFIQNRDHQHYVGFTNSAGSGVYVVSSVLAKNTPQYYVYKSIPTEQTEIYSDEAGVFDSSFNRKTSISTVSANNITKIRVLLGRTMGEGVDRYASTLGLFFAPFCYEGETWFDFPNLMWKKGIQYMCTVEYEDTTGKITSVGEIVPMGYLVNGVHLDYLCEPKQNRTSAEFGGLGGSYGAYRIPEGNLYDKYASYPSNFTYATYPDGLEANMFQYQGVPTNLPSKHGCRPNSNTTRIGLTTVGTYYVYRDLESKSLKVTNSSGGLIQEVTAFSLGLILPPEILLVKVTGGGGGGGGGAALISASAGGGAGGTAGWIKVPTVSSYSNGIKCVVGKGGARRAATDKDRAETGGTSSVSIGGSTYFTATGGTGGKYHEIGNPAGGTASAVNGNNSGYFFTKNGGYGGRRDGGGGQSVTTSSYPISPETTISSWTQSSGDTPGTGGGGGAGVWGNGGTGGSNSVNTGHGGAYGGGGGGAAASTNASARRGGDGASGFVLFIY